MMCDNWRYERLAKHSHEESIGEMKHAQEIIERILYLDGVPNMQRYMKINVGQNVPEQHQFDLQLERDAVARLNPGIELCREQGRQRHRGCCSRRSSTRRRSTSTGSRPSSSRSRTSAPQNYLAQQIEE